MAFQNDVWDCQSSKLGEISLSRQIKIHLTCPCGKVLEERAQQTHSILYVCEGCGKRWHYDSILKTFQLCSHVEAYCLMQYKCGLCDYIETFWNARDGVTPFIVACPKCSNDMSHVNWSSDEYAPEHMPRKGEGIFIGLPPELAPILARMRVEMFDGTEHERKGKDREEIVTGLIGDYTNEKPFLLRWPWPRK